MASSFRGLHESLINYGGNASPEFLTCSHEEISVAMGHGCYKVEARPLAVMPAAPSGCSTPSWRLQRLVRPRAGLRGVRQHPRCEMRHPGVEWNHAAQDVGILVRVM